MLTPANKLGFMVTLCGWTGGTGSQNEQTGTFMHELGTRSASTTAAAKATATASTANQTIHRS